MYKYGIIISRITYHFIDQLDGSGERVVPDSGHGQTVGQSRLTVDRHGSPVFHGFRKTRDPVGFDALKP